MDIVNMLYQNYTFFVVVILLMLGLWAMMAKKNLIKKLIALSIFQTAIILFYISMGAKLGATIPIIDAGHDSHKTHHVTIHAEDYNNPLTQILMLTAIVVGVATIGLGLTLVQRIYKEYGSTDEDDILEAMSNDT